MQKTRAALFLAAALVLSGCSELPEERVCAQIITPAVSADGQCKEFPTPCDVPIGYTIVEKCPEQSEADTACEDVVCEDKCIDSTFNSGGACEKGECVYSAKEENSEKCARPEVFSKYEFDAELLFCEYESLLKKYTFFYQVRNRTDNIPEYRSKVWLKVPSIGYAYDKTIQRDYKKDRILWEDQQYTYVDKIYRGQFWEIRNRDTNSALDFQLIFCEPEYAEEEECTPSTGIVIVEGNTKDLCRITGQPKTP